MNSLLIRVQKELSKEAYLNNKYYEQALDHLTTALKLNGSLFSKLEETKQFHSNILTLLGKCYMEAGNYKDALSLLEKSLKMNKQVLGDDDINNCDIYMEISHVYVKLKEYENALNYISKVWELSEAKFGRESQQVGKCYEELAQVYLKQKNYEEAINYQRKAMETLQALEDYQDLDHIANIAITLSEWLEKDDKIEEALHSLRTAEDIYEKTYSVVDKRTCKVKRNISLLYLKSNKYEEALEILREVEELEKTLYGDGSVQLGKTYKVIGTLYIINNNPIDARDYLMRAHSIFESKGLVKLLKEVKNKIKMLNSSVKLAAEVAAQDVHEQDSGNDSGREISPDRAKMKGVAKKKKGTKKKPKKTVFRNNFVKESDSHQQLSNQ